MCCGSRVQVNVPEKKIILSERAAMLGDLLAALTAGDVVEGVVTRLTDFGAFVSLIGADGKMHGTEVGCSLSHSFLTCHLNSWALRAEWRL